MKKSKFFNFLLSFIPGAGQMYLGEMRRGLELMGLFFGGWAFISFTGISELVSLLFIVWAYSFFDAMHVYNGYSGGSLFSGEYGFYFMNDRKFILFIGGILILMGAKIMVFDFISSLLGSQLTWILRQIIIGVMMIFGGMLLIRNYWRSRHED